MDKVQTVAAHPFAETHIRAKAFNLCQRADFCTSDRDDLRQEMRMHLLEKAHLFEPEKGSPEAFIVGTIKNWVKMHLRYRSQIRRIDRHKAISLEQTMVMHEGMPTPLKDILLEEDRCHMTQAPFVSDQDSFELREAVETTMASLSDDEQRFLGCVAEHGVFGAARELGVSRHYVNIEISRLRIFFEKNGLGPR